MPAGTDDLLDRARAGDRAALARLVSLVERFGPEAGPVLAATYRDGGTSHVVGLTGPPGAGKSTLTNCLVRHARSVGDVAVLAIDPSSPFTGGAILGDRIRMQDHVDDAGVYIRSMANRGHLGGMSAAAPRALAVLDAMGFATILVETVGVGQAEVEIAGRADTTVVVLNPRWGDSIQAAKAGLLEVGDVFVVNKADLPGAAETARDLRQMLEMGPEREWDPPIVLTTATDCTDTGSAWDAIADHGEHLVASGARARRQAERARRDVLEAVAAELRQQAKSAGADARFDDVVASVVARSLDPWSAARDLVGSEP